MNRIVAVVGMPGAGKSEAQSYLQTKGFSSIRFGEATDEKLKQLALSQTPENEQIVREQLRKDMGMEVYALIAKPKIDTLISENKKVVIDGLYSWEEYVYLKKEFPDLIVLALYGRPTIRYERLSQRAIRPFTLAESKIRDRAEIEHLNKGGPIAAADYLIKNESTLQDFHKELDIFLSISQI